MSDKKNPTQQVDLTGEKVQWDFKNNMSYGDYLSLDKILNAQALHTDKHDEMLFILIHQVSELWIKLTLHELNAALTHVQEDNLEPAFKMLARVSKIQNQLKRTWDVLATMTPADYAAFRDSLGHASGFQSHQYRQVEFILGNKNAAMIKVYNHDEDLFNMMDGVLRAPSFYDECLRLLARRGFDIPEAKLERDFSKPYEACPEIEKAWLTVYKDPEKYWDLYALAEKLVDVEDNFQQWRFRHMTTVKRVIGFKRGTGGTAGVGYLVKALQLQFFPELWTVRTLM